MLKASQKTVQQIDNDDNSSVNNTADITEENGQTSVEKSSTDAPKVHGVDGVCCGGCGGQ